MKTAAEILEQPGNIYLISRRNRRGFKAYYPKPLSLRRLKNLLYQSGTRMMNGRIFYRI